MVDVTHAAEVKITKDQIKEYVRNFFKKPHVSLFGIKKTFGGGKTQGFVLVYDNEDSMKRFEPAYRLKRVNFILTFRLKLRNFHPRIERRLVRKKVERFRRLRNIKDRRREVLREDKIRILLGNKIRRRNNTYWLKELFKNKFLPMLIFLFINGVVCVKHLVILF
jgi:ribosomal protein S24E